MSRVALVALFALFAVAFTQDICTNCQGMCDDAKAKYGPGWTCSQSELQTFMEGECKLKFSGIQATVCKSVVDKNSAQMLADFKAGMSSLQICQSANLC